MGRGDRPGGRVHDLPGHDRGRQSAGHRNARGAVYSGYSPPGSNGSSSARRVTQPPTVNWIGVNSTSSSPSIVTVAASTATVSADATDGAGHQNSSNLTYSWAGVALSGGATTVSFSSATSNKPTATFDSVGNYRLTVTVTDAETDMTATSEVDVTVVQAPASIAVTSADPAPVTVAAGGTESFYGRYLDQFGNPMSGQPSVAWSVASGSGRFSSSGVYSAPINSSRRAHPNRGRWQRPQSGPGVDRSSGLYGAHGRRPGHGHARPQRDERGALGPRRGHAGALNLTYYWLVTSEPTGSHVTWGAARGPGRRQHEFQQLRQHGRAHLQRKRILFANRIVLLHGQDHQSGG